MGDTNNKARIETYVQKFEDNADGMTLKEENHREGGSQCSDETIVYESRLKWLKENGGSHRDSIWSNIASGEIGDVKPVGDEEIVYINVPCWFANDDDELSKIYRCNYNGRTISSFAVLRSDVSEDKDAYGFSRFYTDNRGWVTPRNQYKTAWIPKSLCTIYRQVGETRPLDEEKIQERDALKDGVNRLEASQDDYDWRLALGAAYRRCEGEEDSPVNVADDNAQNLPDKLYDKVEIGVDEYMRQASAENRDVGEIEIAIVINSLTRALTPGVRNEYEDD